MKTVFKPDRNHRNQTMMQKKRYVQRHLGRSYCNRKKTRVTNDLCMAFEAISESTAVWANLLPLCLLEVCEH